MWSPTIEFKHVSHSIQLIIFSFRNVDRPMRFGRLHRTRTGWSISSREIQQQLSNLKKRMRNLVYMVTERAKKETYRSVEFYKSPAPTPHYNPLIKSKQQEETTPNKQTNFKKTKRIFAFYSYLYYKKLTNYKPSVSTDLDIILFTWNPFAFTLIDCVIDWLRDGLMAWLIYWI